MYTIQNEYIHGSSYIVALSDIEFFSWKRNEESGEYWVKLHVPSGKEIRIRVTQNGLYDIVSAWAGTAMQLKIGEKYELDY